MFLRLNYGYMNYNNLSLRVLERYMYHGLPSRKDIWGAWQEVHSPFQSLGSKLSAIK